MKTDLIGEDVVVRISTPQIITSSEATGAGGGAGGRAGAGSAAAECGRRLLLAAGQGDSAAVRALMARGAPFTADWLGTSPLHLAAANDHADTVTVLLRAGVSRDARTKVERTPLHLAASAGHAAAAAALLDAGAAVDARDMLGMTPLHWAAQRGHPRLVRLLLAHGASPALRSKFRLTPRDVAARAGRADIARLLDEAERLRDERDEARERDAERERDAAAAEALAAPRAPSPPAAPPAEPAAGEALLRRHGITLLPADESGTVLRALHSGRTVVLSDAGKLMLKESSAGGAAAPASAPGGVVLTATPARSPPAPGVKVFTLSAAGRLATPKVVAAAPPAAPAPADPAAPAPRPAVKIIMNRANFRKLVASAAPAEEPAEAEGPLRVPEQFLRSSSPGYLRAQLLAAHAALHALTAELRAVRARLARYEPPPER